MIMAAYAAESLFRIIIVCLLISNFESVKRSKLGCVVCGKKSQQIYFRDASAYTGDLESCFGILSTFAGDICEGCRRAIQEHRRSGKTFHHVSFVSSYY